MTVVGTQSTFSTNDREDPALASVTETSQSTWVTTYFEGPNLDDVCKDDYRP